MRLHRVRLRNFRGITDSNVEFSESGVTIVEGPNEVGKTSIAEALRLAIDYPDSSKHKKIKSVQPVNLDKGPGVEIEVSSGPYRLTYCKRWLKKPMTTIEVTLPWTENRTGRDAHNRLKSILAETLDEQLWSALRIEQGTELKLPGFESRSLARALEEASGGHSGAEQEDPLWDRIGNEYHRYWTRTGRRNAFRKKLGDSVEEAKTKVADLQRQLNDIDADADRYGRLIVEERRLAALVTEFEKRESELAGRWDSTQTLRDEIERLSTVFEGAKAERDLAAGEQKRRRELIAALDSARQAFQALKAEAEKSAPTLAQAVNQREETAAALNGARSALRSAEKKHRLAIADRDHLRQVIEVAQLTERHERYELSAASLKETEGYLDSATVDDDLAESIELAHLNHERASARAEISSASVEITALRNIIVSIDDETVELADGDFNRTRVDDETTVVIPYTARMRVSAGRDSQRLTEHRNRTQEAYRRLCHESGVADLAAARQAAQRRRDAERNRKEALKAIKENLRDLTPEVLLQKIAGLSRRVDSYPQERSGDTPLPDGYSAARRMAEEIERRVARARDERDTCKAAAEEAAAAHQEAQIEQEVLSARIIDARRGEESAARRLDRARDYQTDEALTDALAMAGERAKEGQGKLEEAQASLVAADPDSLKALLENAGNAARRASNDLKSNKHSQTELRIKLEILGEQGLHTDHEDEVSRLKRIGRDYDRLEARAAAVRLLRETFAKRRQEAYQRYVGPFQERINEFGRIVFGPDFAVEVSSDLRVVRRTLNGTSLDVDQLSTGAREQLGVISRLACAAIVSPRDGGVPVMIDDALGWSDPKRLEAMGAAIAAAGKQCQIIVLTCTPGRYSHVGNATVVNL